MNFSDVELPSNRKFGFFFTLIFLAAAGYFFVTDFITASYTFVILAVTFLLTTLVKANVLLPLNKLWMRLGLLLGIIVSPIVLGMIFFVMFTPVAFLMRVRGRDELRLKFKNKNTHWINRTETGQIGSFKHQF